MLEYLIYILKCVGCISAILVIVFLTIQILYINPKKALEMKEYEKELMNKIADKVLKKVQEDE